MVTTSHRRRVTIIGLILCGQLVAAFGVHGSLTFVGLAPACCCDSGACELDCGCRPSLVPCPIPSVPISCCSLPDSGGCCCCEFEINTTSEPSPDDQFIQNRPCRCDHSSLTALVEREPSVAEQLGSFPLIVEEAESHRSSNLQPPPASFSVPTPPPRVWL